MLSQDQGEVIHHSFVTRLHNPGSPLYTTLLLGCLQISPPSLPYIFGQVMCILMDVLRITIASILQWMGQLKP